MTLVGQLIKNSGFTNNPPPGRLRFGAVQIWVEICDLFVSSNHCFPFKYRSNHATVLSIASI